MELVDAQPHQHGQRGGAQQAGRIRRACAAHQGDKPLFQQQNAHPAGCAGQKAGLAQLAAHNAGADLVKLFPTATMGLKYFKDLRAPLSHIGLVVTAGVTLDNLGDYLKAGAFAAGISSPLCNKELIAAGNFAEITRRARAFRGIANPTVKA